MAEILKIAWTDSARRSWNATVPPLNSVNIDDVTRDIICIVRVVLDTSVIITALRSSMGAAAEVIRLAFRRELTPLMDYKLACEYRNVALRPEQLHGTGKSQVETAAILDALEAIAEPVYVAFQHRPLSPDVDDDMVLDVAINGNANAIVTNNTRHFREAAERFGVNLLVPAELLSKYRKRR